MQSFKTQESDKTDALIALALGIAALAVYVRTLAPDILYSDSAEFQTLAYTLGTTHSTGYPVYLLFAWLVGFIPVGSLAWRINLFSALSAAAALSGLYLLIRSFTRSRAGAVLGSLALAQSYTFWSQAIIAEVYTPAIAFVVAILLLLRHWQVAPELRNRSLLAAAFLSGLGLGIHAFVPLIGPATAAWGLWTVWAASPPRPPSPDAIPRLRSGQEFSVRRGGLGVKVASLRRSLISALMGLALGVGLFLLAFWLFDRNNPPSNFVQVTLYPSRSIWGLSAADLDSPVERFVATVTGRQWQDAMFAVDDTELVGVVATYLGRLGWTEFSLAMLFLAGLGVTRLWRADLRWCLFQLAIFATAVYVVFNYEPGDKYVFYLPTYLLIVMAIGVGSGSLLEKVNQLLAARPPWQRRVVLPLMVGLLVVIVVQPRWRAGPEALRAGAATFVEETYAYPVDDLQEPRKLAHLTLSEITSDEAVLVMDWRALYSIYYLAHVEGMRPGLTIFEATPHGSEGKIAETLLQEIRSALEAGRPVFADKVYEALQASFRLRPVGTGHWREVLLR